MTDLSPAAQAVFNAAWDHNPVNCASVEDIRRQQIATALRAAAGHLNATSPWPDHIESTGVNWSRNELLTIAAELERQDG